MAPDASVPLSSQLVEAARILAEVAGGRSLDDALDRLPAGLRPGVQAIAYRALRDHGPARVLVARLVARPPAPAVLALLHVALALAWPHADEPAPYAEHTLVDQAVEAARRLAPASAGLVNAVLRRFLRERAALVVVALEDEVARHGHPGWWLARLRADWPDDWVAIAAADRRRAPMALRVNRQRTTVEAMRERLVAAGLDPHPGPHPLAPAGVVLRRAVPVDALPGFADGLVSVQDLSAQIAAPLLLEGIAAPSDRPLRILDACAAPGGKTGQLLELSPDADVLALDRDAARLDKVAQTLARLGLAATLRAADAGEPGGWWDGRPFDAILLDAPCTASGIVRRHPDVPWLRRPSDIASLARGQRRLLDALWPLLAPGGRLVYAACSVFRDEGSRQIDAFLQRHGDAAIPAAPRAPGHLVPNAENREPPTDGGPTADRPPTGDGFFHALLERRPTQPAP